MKADFVESAEGSVAQAVGDSIANPFIFNEIDVRTGGAIDPGIDRVAAVPIEQACNAFPDRRMLAVNVTDKPSFVSTRMHCPAFEVAVPLDPSAGDPFTDHAAFDKLVEAGKRATAG